MDANNTTTFSATAVETLRQESCVTATQLHLRADKYSRVLRPSANTNDFSGLPSGFVPFLSKAQDEGTLTRTVRYTGEQTSKVAAQYQGARSRFSHLGREEGGASISSC